jgi:uncharacterized protein
VIQFATPESITVRAGRCRAKPPSEYRSRRCGSYPVALLWGTLRRVREIRWTSESEAHIARHGVTPEEVEQAITNKPRYEAPGREDSTLLYSATDEGRLLLVVLAEAVDGRWYVATAREMTDTERRTFRRKGR